jgi:hypothetical protein
VVAVFRQVFGCEGGVGGSVKVRARAARTGAFLAALVCVHLSGAACVALAAEAPPVVIENVGQFDAAARFRIPGSGSTIWISDGAIWITTLEAPRDADASDPRALRGRDAPDTGESRKGVALRLTFSGANRDARITPFGRQATKISYFRGAGAGGTHADVPVWSGVRYEEIYPGVDLEVTGSGGAIAPRFVAKISADLASLLGATLSVEGADSVACDGGTIRCRTSAGDVSVPLFGVVSATDGADLSGDAVPEARGCAVARPFARMSGGAAGKGSLPGLLYGTFLGGIGMDGAQAIAVDASGNAYVTGRTYSDSFPITPGSFSTVYHDEDDAFVAKLLFDGSLLLYATYLGGDKGDYGMGIAVNAAGEAFVTGMTASPNFPVTPGAFKTTYSSGGYTDAFVVRIAPSGASLIYSTYLGGDGFVYEAGQAIAADSAGNAYVTGTTCDPNFPVTPGAFQSVPDSNWDAFVTKVAPDGSALLYSSYLGGDGDDTGYGIAVDSSGRAYVTGVTSSANFPVTPGAFQPARAGGSDAFIARISSAGTTLLDGTYLGGSSGEFGYGICVDAVGNVYVAGATPSTNFPTTPGAFRPAFCGGVWDGFVTKLHFGGVGLAWSSYLGGNDTDTIHGIALDASGNVYVSGWTASTNFPVTAGAPQTVIGGSYDTFVARFGPDGATLPFATYLGGIATDDNKGLGVDASGNAIITGFTESSNFPVTEGAFQTHYGGGLIFDAFVAKVRTAGGVTPAVVGSSGGGGCAAAGTPWMALLLAAALLTCRRRRR